MSIYLGNSGGVTIKRTAVGAGFIGGTLQIADVDANANRFSFDFPSSAIITGDRIEIATQDGSNLELVEGHDFPDGRWFAHVDMAGGIRLYDTFEKSINGGFTNAISLITPSKSQPIFIRNRDDDYNCVAQIQSYDISTSRENVDLTVLGESFRENYANGLISGQGSLTCLWDYRKTMCDPNYSAESETPNYFAQLLLRLEQGSSFMGHFFVNRSTSPAVWYQADCVVTNVAFTFEPAQAIQTVIQFVTSGEIRLMMGELPAFLLQQDDDLILLEQTGALELEEPAL